MSIPNYVISPCQMLYVHTKLSYMFVPIYVICPRPITLHVRAIWRYMFLPNYVICPCQITLHVLAKLNYMFVRNTTCLEPKIYYLLLSKLYNTNRSNYLTVELLDGVWLTPAFIDYRMYRTIPNITLRFFLATVARKVWALGNW